MDQHTFVRDCLAYYEEQGLTPEPGGEWQEAHYPDPRDVGDKTIWMLHNDHQQQGLYQSEEYQRPCFYNYDTLRFLTRGPFVPGWFDLWDLYDKWKGYNQSTIPRETLVANGKANSAAMNDHENTQAGRVAGGKAAGKANIANIPREMLAANGKANSAAMNDHENTRKQQKANGKSNMANMPKEVLVSNSEATNSQRWQCLVTGFVSSPGGLSSYQKARGIETSSRVRLEGTVSHTP
jgi:hypothetical protein